MKKISHFFVKQCKLQNTKYKTLNLSKIVKQYKVVNYVLFLSDFPIGESEKPIYNECRDGDMILFAWSNSCLF